MSLCGLWDALTDRAARVLEGSDTVGSWSLQYLRVVNLGLLSGL